MKTKILTSRQLDQAAELLCLGQLVAIPTETVYGLAALSSCESAITSIFTIKQRALDNPLIVHISDFEQIDQLALAPPELFFQLAKAFFPGPLTLITRRHPKLSPLISAGLESVAIRMPSHPIAKELIRMLKKPIVAPSANISGRPSATEARHVLEDFDQKISAVVDGGRTDFGLESTVVSLLTHPPVILRPGKITKQEVEEVLGIAIDVQTSLQNGPAYSPGMKYRHYAPCIPIKLFYNRDAMGAYLKEFPSYRRVFLGPADLSVPNCDCYELCVRDLYASFRHAEKNGFEEIIVFCDLAAQNDLALMNRLLKASN